MKSHSCRICSSSHYLNVFDVYQNLDLSNKIFYCFLTAMAKINSVDRKASFCLLEM